MPCVLSNTTRSSTSVETVIHPRNLNLVFVAYAGLLRELLKGLRLSDMVIGRWCYLNWSGLFATPHKFIPLLNRLDWKKYTSCIWVNSVTWSPWGCWLWRSKPSHRCPSLPTIFELINYFLLGHPQPSSTNGHMSGHSSVWSSLRCRSYWWFNRLLGSGRWWPTTPCPDFGFHPSQPCWFRCPGRRPW